METSAKTLKCVVEAEIVRASKSVSPCNDVQMPAEFCAASTTWRGSALPKFTVEKSTVIVIGSRNWKMAGPDEMLAVAIPLERLASSFQVL